ncbi:MAG: UDP-N-acetylenolpyruvoylglucosamine reductase [Candidatus Harrisonbacteria bacterium RIFCSPLOWO2_02_FULL_41_13b]|uniref:UDP-N-acetylenolpyruvoylglucosamine reductase n=1 Tax=Candidatus Harrisonbacteria bacterium RIFCSPLOWO2_02_FULL_41_13b TaxID=1798409 RepID=A0A1G1ZU69_9BACT|nr:MAG: UDP-N-acetylenolpyruvoylglucosamine reductase [Candidatus Harrisonbacteria bacterium RIFCSPHIGHO2_02_FULL_40_20]OGY68122.1 MAG: UDP-N-acetylenolpyruvoylglucosamine reductase [Candidatus Harrisonbacteria bacterium RIFCSPLOWO2_02_FULL_41_13b]
MQDSLSMFQSEVNLKHLSNYKIGGGADYFFSAKDIQRLIGAVAVAEKNNLPIFILGGGTNLLINDGGFKGLVLKPDIKKLEIEKSDKEQVLVRVGSGILVTEFLNFLISNSLSGMEWAGGLPGTVGGAIRGNAGAFTGETKDAVAEVVSLDISKKQPKIIRRDNKECKFGYRNSIFKINDGREIITEAVFYFQRGDKQAIKKLVEEKINYRRSRHPMEYPNIGSIFKNVDLRLIPKNKQKNFANIVKKDPFPVIPTAYLISEAGLRGVSYGGAMISPKHPNFIVNALDANAKDVKTLINLVKASVKRKFGVSLEEEIIYV